LAPASRAPGRPLPVTETQSVSVAHGGSSVGHSPSLRQQSLCGSVCCPWVSLAGCRVVRAAAARLCGCGRCACACWIPAVVSALHVLPYMSVCLPCMSVCLPLFLPAYLPACLSVCLPAYLPTSCQESQLRGPPAPNGRRDAPQRKSTATVTASTTAATAATASGTGSRTTPTKQAPRRRSTRPTHSLLHEADPGKSSHSHTPTHAHSHTHAYAHTNKLSSLTHSLTHVSTCTRTHT
jgi:hypothetical protein